MAAGKKKIPLIAKAARADARLDIITVAPGS